MRKSVDEMSQEHLRKARCCDTAMVSGLVRAAEVCRLLAPQIMTMSQQVFKSGFPGRRPSTTAPARRGRGASIRPRPKSDTTRFGVVDVERLLPITKPLNRTWRNT
jgi:hypothetical protein